VFVQIRKNTTFWYNLSHKMDDFKKSIYYTLMLALLYDKVYSLNLVILSETKPAIKLQSLLFLFFRVFKFFHLEFYILGLMTKILRIEC
jgi:hypothetical protein